MKEFDSPYFAAVDLGSNSFHMLITRIKDGKVETVDREKQMVQLARGLQSDGSLDQDAQERALTCLHRFSERLRDIPDSQIRAVGTKTLRAATDSDRFLREAERALGVKIQIISGYEEARLVYAGLANTISKNTKRLVIDIGGGSTEFIIGTGYEPSQLESLAMGCVSFSAQFIEQPDGPTNASMHDAYLHACAEIEEIRNNYLKEGWETAYGTSGTMKAVAELLADTDGGALITKKSLGALIEDTIANGKITSSNVSKLRREVLPAGLAILQAIFDQLKLERIHIAGATLKEGLIYDTLGRYDNHDSRMETIGQLIERYHIDQQQAQLVSDASARFWSNIDSPNLPGVSRTKILRWAAKLHEIGLSISHSSYHHHGAYLIRHSDLAGFGRYEQFILASLIQLHRKKLTEEKIKGIDETALPAFIPLLICLRLAVILYRRRESIDSLPSLSCDEGSYTLHLQKSWLDAHPLTLASLEQEQNYLEAIGVTLAIAT